MGLVDLSQVNVLLDSSRSDETIHVNISQLADSIGSVLGLQINGRIPVGIEDDDHIGSRYIESHAASSEFGLEKDLRPLIEAMPGKVVHYLVDMRNKKSFLSLLNLLTMVKRSVFLVLPSRRVKV